MDQEELKRLAINEAKIIKKIIDLCEKLPELIGKIHIDNISSTEYAESALEYKIYCSDGWLADVKKEQYEEEEDTINYSVIDGHEYEFYCWASEDGFIEVDEKEVLKVLEGLK